MSTPFLKAILSSLASLLSDSSPIELVPLSLTFVATKGTDLILNDGKYDYQTENFLSFPPRKVDPLSQFVSGFIIIQKSYINCLTINR